MIKNEASAFYLYVLHLLEDANDLRFESFARSYRGDWLNVGKMIRFVIKNNIVKGKSQGLVKLD